MRETGKLIPVREGRADPLNDTRVDGLILPGSESKIDAVRLLSWYLLLLMAIPASLVFAPLGAAGGPSTILALVLFVILLVSWLHPRLGLDHGPQPVRTVGILFASAVIASYTSANRHAMPVLETNAADRGLLFTFGWIGVMLLAADAVMSMDRLRVLIRRVVFGATGMALIGIEQFLTGFDVTKYIRIPGLTALSTASDLLSRGSLNRPSATASHPIEFGAVLVMALPLALHQARFAGPGDRRRRWTQAGLIAMAAPMTVSRSAILGLAIVGLALLPTWPKRDRRIAYVAAVVGSVGMWLSVHGLVGTITGLFLNIGSDTSTASRNSAISGAGVYIAQHPWLGRGLGTLLPQTYFYVDDQYLTSLIETGFIGTLALLTVFITGWCLARSGRRFAGGDSDRDLGQCLAASVAVATVSFATYDALSFPIASGLVFLMVGCCGAYWRLQRTSSGSQMPGAERTLEPRNSAQEPTCHGDRCQES